MRAVAHPARLPSVLRRTANQGLRLLMDGPEILPVPKTAPQVIGPDVASALPKLERDYLMVALFVRIQHLRFAEAAVLIRALITAGEITPDLLFAKAVVENAMGAHEAALSTVRHLEHLSPAMAEAKTKATRRARMRAYIKAKASFALTGELDDEARAALDFYLRHGRSKKRSTEE
jgi:hypothetical protein